MIPDAWLIVAAFGLDLFLGDPVYRLHPVRLMGAAATGLEGWLRKKTGSLRLAGAFLTVVIVVGSWLLTVFVGRLILAAGVLWSALFSTLVIYSAIAARGLFDESVGVFRALRVSDLVTARRRLARIVGRDTDRLDEPGIVRAVIETVAESASDGIVAPLFYAALGGPPLAMAYKAVNTLDSMIGHRDERYRDFGRFAARLDDLANYLPARLTGVLMVVAAAALGYDPRGAWRTLWRDGKKHPSPNAGYPEAATAGALGVRLGGVNVYAGIEEPRPFIGDPRSGLGVTQITRVNRLLLVTAFGAVLYAAALSGFR